MRLSAPRCRISLTPDGRTVPAFIRNSTPERRIGILIEGSGGASGLSRDDTATLIAKVIGSNALSDHESRRNVIQMIRSAPASENSAATLALLKQLAADAEQPALKKELAAAIAFVQPL